MFPSLILAAVITPGQPPAQTGGIPLANAAPPLYYMMPAAAAQPTGMPQQSSTQPASSDPKSGDAKDNKGSGEAKEEPKKVVWIGERLKLDDPDSTFPRRLYSAYYDQFFPPSTPAPADPPLPRRAPDSPWSAPPFPGNEYQGYPLLGVPIPPASNPIMKAVYGGPWGDEIKDSRIFFEGWMTSGTFNSTAKNSNVPTSYEVVPNRTELDQLIFKLERIPDSVQTDHWDWGFRSVALYGMDYRYTTAGGWGSEQLLKHNLLYGWDPVEQYFNVYIPGFLGGTDIRVGRWIACPDIETQYSVNNYLASHSILFTYDTYTQTGIMVTQKLNEQWEVQGVLHSGTDMAPWYPGATPTLAVGARWVSKDNNDAFYTWANALNSAQFRHFYQYDQPLGHDNFNYIVSTWEHRFSDSIHTKTEAYYMWQYNAEVGGTPSAGPLQPYGGGGGDGVLIPGRSNTYGILNYTMFGLSDRDYITVRNEYFRDERGMRTGFSGTYTSHTIGLSHQFNDVMMIRPEIGYYRNWTENAFDNGTRKDLWLYGFDFTYRF